MQRGVENQFDLLVLAAAVLKIDAVPDLLVGGFTVVQSGCLINCRISASIVAGALHVDRQLAARHRPNEPLRVRRVTVLPTLDLGAIFRFSIAQVQNSAALLVD